MIPPQHMLPGSLRTPLATQQGQSSQMSPDSAQHFALLQHFFSIFLDLPPVQPVQAVTDGRFVPGMQLVEAQEPAAHGPKCLALCRSLAADWKTTTKNCSKPKGTMACIGNHPKVSQNHLFSAFLYLSQILYVLHYWVTIVREESKDHHMLRVLDHWIAVWHRCICA